MSGQAVGADKTNPISIPGIRVDFNRATSFRRTLSQKGDRVGHGSLQRQPIFVIQHAKEDLILSKLVRAMPTESSFQLRDVRKLLASGADEAYLDRWSETLGVAALLRKCKDAGYDP